MEENNFIDKRFQSILDTVVDAIIGTDINGTVDLFNPSAEILFGYKHSEIVGKNIKMLMPEPFHSQHDIYMENYRTTGKKKVIGIGREAVAMRKDGTIFPIDLAVGEAVVNDVVQYTGIVRDISERKGKEKELETYKAQLEQLVTDKTRELADANEQLKKLIRIDSLTQIANRRHFDEKLEEEYQRAMRKNDLLVLALFDIDCFKGFNDYYGHHAGDLCLRKIAACLKKSFQRSSDLVVRYGGDEFAIILPHTETEIASQLCKRFFKKIKNLHIEHKGSDVAKHVTCSLGIASIRPKKGSTAGELIIRADKALYGAKKNGRNTILIDDIT